MKTYLTNHLKLQVSLNRLLKKTFSFLQGFYPNRQESIWMFKTIKLNSEFYKEFNGIQILTMFKLFNKKSKQKKN